MITIIRKSNIGLFIRRNEVGGKWNQER